jgi:aldehyde dehydrogenase (NAD+)/phenylacetaldehyde dehydrogenase
VEAIVEEAQGIVLGHGLAPDTQMGPLVSDVQLARVTGLVDSGKQQGATVACGGEHPGGDLSAGYFMQPTVFTNVEDDMRIAQEEIFGPVLSVFSFEDEEEVIARANASRYGLVGAVWTNDLKRAHRVAAQLEAGTVWVNAYNILDPTTPFGGYKDSGVGRDLGLEAVHSFTQTKSVWVNLD